MGRVRIVYSKLPDVARAIPREEREGLHEFGTELTDQLKANVWKRWGYIGASVKDHSLDALALDIWVGVIGEIGFYSGFNEFGTVKQAPRPVVGPTAHLMEPRLIQIMSEHIRQAGNAG